ncbi:alpha/beta fold hydrolase [Actibacterium sp. 188UL27-1]|uniref:alpha/beta fold hydrolase n=1 Tax=Actibacterium sp. 188UL27-1 TaxID=2786961 RepID=UPI001957291A|nr:alpha/beta hydrolase [Actibacterium sp. 188UL27-1]MBM7066590.1 alpha/beta hydrolase [Actibacterium sp. 188UL27-1]
MERAPYYDDIASGPAATAHWLTADDGARIRVAAFAGGTEGTVLLFTGRTEYIEKYARVAQDFLDRGLTTLVVDWRGQGLSDRLTGDASLGHVAHFSDYQLDVGAVTTAAAELELPKPWYLLGHSMGGAIGLRALHNGLPVEAAACTGPMWGISLNPILRPVAWAVSGVSRHLGLGAVYAPGTKPTNYVISAAFQDNLLTTDAESYELLRHQLQTHPELAIGGPSLAWLNEALWEIRDLRRRPAPDVPAITFIGDNERIVDMQAVRDRMQSWPGGEIVVLPGGEHEILMEARQTRHTVIDRMVGFFKTTGSHSATQAKAAS